MFNFKNEYEQNPMTYSNRGLQGLSKYWRYSTLDAQNKNNIINNNFPKSSKFTNPVGITSPDDITLEISYDNFYTLGVDMMKKKKYAEELKKQIEEKQMRKNLERQRKKLEDLNEEIRLEKERKIIEDRQKENNKRILPRINYSPYPRYPIQHPIKIYTPPPPIISQHKTPKKPKINTSDVIPKYIYRKFSNSEETKKFLREREDVLERFNRDMKNQLEMLKDEFNLGMKKLNDEIHNLNNGIGSKNNNYRYLISEKLNEINSEIKNNNNKNSNIQTEHIYNIIRKSKDGKTRIERFVSNPNNFISPFEENKYIEPYNIDYLNIIKDNKSYDEFIDNNEKLPYINLSHCISYC